MKSIQNKSSFYAACMVFVVGVVMAGCIPFVLFAQTPTPVPTSFQFIHNSADPTFDPMDVSLGKVNARGEVENTFTIRNSYFRSNTPPLTMLGETVTASLFGTQLSLRFSSTTGTIPPSIPYETIPLRLGLGANIIIAGGNLNTRNFVKNPNNKSIEARLFQFIDTVSTTTASTVRILLFHGVTDAPGVDISVRGVGRLATLQYGDGAFVNVPTGDYIIDVRASTSQTLVGTFVAPLQSLNLAGQRITLMASGFFTSNTRVNRSARNQVLTPLSLVLVPSDSLSKSFTLSSQLPVPPPPATLQIINNAADPQFNRMSIWAGEAVTTGTVRFIPAVPNITFRSATQSTDAFVTFVPNQGGGPGNPGTPARQEILLGSVIGTLLAINPAINQLRPGQTIDFTRFPGTSIAKGNSIVIAHGVNNIANFAQNPDTSVNRGLRLTSFTDTQDSVDTNVVRVLFFHGVTDAPAVDIVLRETGDTLATLGYGQGTFLTLPPNLYTLDVVVHNAENLLGSFVLPLFEHPGKRITVMSSGFLNSAANRNGTPFGMVLVSPVPDRRPDILTPLSLPNASAPTTLQLINNSSDDALTAARFWLGIPTANPNLNINPNPNNPNANANATITSFSIIEPSVRFPSGALAQSGFGELIPFFKDVISVPLTLTLTATTSRNSTTAVLSSSPFMMGRGANILISSGVQRPSLYAPNPDNRPTNLKVYQFVDKFALTTSDVVRLMVFHGVSDAPRVDIVARGNFPMLATVATLVTQGTAIVTTINTVTIFTSSTMTLASLSYTDAAFATLPTGDYSIDIRASATQTTIASYTATFATMSLGGQRITLAASGFLNNSQKSQTTAPLRMLAVVNTITPLTTTINSVTVATTTTGTLVTSITTTTINVPHSFLLPAQTLPQATSLAIATQALVGEQEQVAGKSPVSTADTDKELNDGITNVNSFPNPTTDNVSIQYTLKESGNVSVSVYDAFGQRIAQFAPINQDAGQNMLTLDTHTLTRGAYQVMITTTKGINRTKVMIVR
jgi:Secretion system C-terminal sorting domain